VPCRVKAEHPLGTSDGLPCECLDAAGWRLYFPTAEQGKPGGHPGGIWEHQRVLGGGGIEGEGHSFSLFFYEVILYYVFSLFIINGSGFCRRAMLLETSLRAFSTERSRARKKAGE
jgi:hypothetical protein